MLVSISRHRDVELLLVLISRNRGVGVIVGIDK